MRKTWPKIYTFSKMLWWHDSSWSALKSTSETAATICFLDLTSMMMPTDSKTSVAATADVIFLVSAQMRTTKATALQQVVPNVRKHDGPQLLHCQLKKTKSTGSNVIKLHCSIDYWWRDSKRVKFWSFSPRSSVPSTSGWTSNSSSASKVQ